MSEKLHEVPVVTLRDMVVYPHGVQPLFIGTVKSIRAPEPAQEQHDKKILLLAKRDPVKENPDADDLFRAKADDAIDAACIKISRLGGLTKSRFARDFCAAAGITLTVEDSWGGGVVTAALAHLAVSTPPEVLLNTTDLHNYNTVQFASGAPEAKGGTLVVGDEPGLGVHVDEAALGDPVAVYE